MRSYESWCRILQGERLPAYVVDLDAFDRNVRTVAGLVRPSGRGLRVASKSLRVPALIRRVLDAGPPFAGVMCFAADEAALLADQGLDDLLVAYPTLDPTELAALRALHDRGLTVSLVVDSRAGLRALADAMQGAARPFPFVVEVDVSTRLGGLVLGVRRSPLRTAEQVIELVRQAAALTALRFGGLMAYEAQVAGLGDDNPFKRHLNPAFRAVRELSRRRVARRRGALAAALERRGVPLPLFNGGGSGSLNLADQEGWLTELTAGSAFLCPHLFDYYRNVRFEPAAFFALQVVRAPDPRHITCQGGGYVASGEPGWDKVPIPASPPGLQLLSAEACGEVQTPLRLPPGLQVPPGAPVLFRHAKGGEPAERFAEALLVSGEQIMERVPTYRGLGAAFF